MLHRKKDVKVALLPAQLMLMLWLHERAFPAVFHPSSTRFVWRHQICCCCCC
jgi:hypothetical protein